MDETVSLALTVLVGALTVASALEAGRTTLGTGEYDTNYHPSSPRSE